MSLPLPGHGAIGSPPTDPQLAGLPPAAVGPAVLPSVGPPFDLHEADVVPNGVLDQHYAALSDFYTRTRYYNLAYPGFYDITHRRLAHILTEQLLNNVGDIYDDGHGRDHSKAHERAVVGYVADLLGAPAGRWGYVTSGSSEGTDHALADARLAFPGQRPVVFTSVAAHYSVTKAAERHQLTLVMISTDPSGRISIDDLRTQLQLFRHRPAVIVATAGTTMTEAVDDVAAIATLCDDLAITRRRIHVDAALAGMPLALLPENDKPGFDFTAGATSIVTSGHKFLSTLTPCAVLVYAEAPVAARAPRVPYTGSGDTTITGSRSGHTPLLLFSSLAEGATTHRNRARQAREMAAYAQDRLSTAGWPAQRGPLGFTVVFDEPPPMVLRKWVLAPDGRQAHIIAKPNTTTEQIDELAADLAGLRRTTIPLARTRPTVARANAQAPVA